MKGFIGGIVTMILVLVLGLAFALMGFVNMRADNPPSKMESTLAGHAMDASVAMHLQVIGYFSRCLLRCHACEWGPLSERFQNSSLPRRSVS